MDAYAVFSGYPANFRIYVPADSVVAYKAAARWGYYYASRIFSIDEMP